MNAKIVGVTIGIVFGIVLFWLGVGVAFAVLGFAFLGWLIGKIVNGEIDIIGYLETISHRKRER